MGERRMEHKNTLFHHHFHHTTRTPTAWFVKDYTHTNTHARDKNAQKRDAIDADADNDAYYYYYYYDDDDDVFR